MEHPTISKYRQHVNPEFIKLLGVFGYGRVFERAEDVWVWDHAGNRYLDFLAGFGSVNLGHNHPRLLADLHRFLDSSRMNLCQIGPGTEAAELAEKLAGVAPAGLDITLFSNSGGEAVEAGMKLARAATKRSGFVFCDNGFHGTNFGTLSIMGGERLRAPFEPLLEHCVRIPFGDLNALKKALSSRNVAGFVVEPIQAEGGIAIPPAGYLAEAQALCRQFGTLLIVDEVQTGLGRTGKLFACEHDGFSPDVLVLAKALSGGLAPIGATLVTAEIFKRAYGSMERFDLHSSTFGGNAFSCVAGISTLDIISAETLTERSAVLGEHLLAGFRKKLAGHPLVRDIRGRGFLVGIELGPTEAGWANKLAPGTVAQISKHVFGQWAALKLLERGVIVQPASQVWNVLRFEPPLTVTEDHIGQVVEAVADVLGTYQGVAPLLADVAARLGTQWWKGWTFP